MSEPFAFRNRSRRGGRQGHSHETSFLRTLELGLLERIEFFEAFIREPTTVGALSPSSKALARAMIEGMRLGSADAVVEVGPGTGAFTGLIRERIGRKTTLIALELDPGHTRSLKRRFPDLIVYNDSAEKMTEYLAHHGKHRADYIISGLPWASISLAVQERIMKAVLVSLAPAGVFTTFAYFHARWLPNARRFRRSLAQQFQQVETSPIVWRNLPPAFVYRCAKPIR